MYLFPGKPYKIGIKDQQPSAFAMKKFESSRGLVCLRLEPGVCDRRGLGGRALLDQRTEPLELVEQLLR